jgi:hypothetical protein
VYHRRVVRNFVLPAGAALLVAGCASGDDSLVWSAAVSRELYRETSQEVEVASFSKAPPGEPAPPWEPFVIVRGSTPTAYRLVQLGDTTALEADSREGGTGLYRKIKIAPDRYPILEWRWRVPRPASGPPVSVASRSSPMVRLSLAFDGDPTKLDFEDRTKLRLAKMLTAHGLPYATLLYVWMYKVPVGTVLRSPHTDRVRMIVVENGEQRLDQWVSVQRNVVEDYRRAFDEDPGDIVAVGVMTDVGDDGSPRKSYYGDITFRQANGQMYCCR